MYDIYSRLVEEAAGLVKFSKKSTLSASEFQTATRLILREYSDVLTLLYTTSV